MRLPTANPNRGVQSLGRRDINAPMRVANSNVRAAQYEGAGLRALGGEVRQIGAYMEQRADQQAVDEYNTEYLKAQAEVELAMGVVMQPLIPADTPGMSGIDYRKNVTIPAPDGGTEEVPRDAVPNYEVGGQWLTNRVDSIRDAALGNITSRRAKEKFSAQFGLLSARSHTNAASVFMKQRTSDRKGGYEVNKEKYLQQNDEQSAKALVAQAFAARTITAEEAAADIIAIGARIDTNIYGKLIAESDDQSSIESTVDIIESGQLKDPETGEIRNARLNPTELRAMMNQANKKLTLEDAEQDRRHEEGKEKAADLYLSGKLTIADVRQLSRDDAINASTAFSLASMLRTQSKEGVTLKSTPGLVDAITKQILFTPDVEQGETMEERAAKLEAQIKGAMSGIDANGKRIGPGQPPLTGADGKKLLGYLAKVKKDVYDSPAMQEADRLLRTETRQQPRGTLSMLDTNTPDALDARRAYDEGTFALRDYVDRNGSDADPVAWVQQNEAMFDPAITKQTRLSEFIKSPPGQVLLPFTPPRTSLSQEYTSEDMTAAIGLAVSKGQIDEEQALLYYDKMNGLDVDAVLAPGAGEAMDDIIQENYQADKAKWEAQNFLQRWMSDEPAKPARKTKAKGMQ